MLADIELAQTLQAASGEEEKLEEVPHPLDRDYQLLKCQLQLLDNGGPEYKVSSAHLPFRYVGSPGSPYSLFVPRPKKRCKVRDHRALVPESPNLGHQALLSPGNTDLPGTDWQQLQMPNSATCLESEQRRGGKGYSAPVSPPCPSGDNIYLPAPC